MPHKMPHKSVADMTADEYQAFAHKLEKRHGAGKTWEELPVIHRPGRPAKGRKATPLKARSVKLPPPVWKMIETAAKRHGVTTSGVVAGLALQVANQDDIDRAIDRLIRRGILIPV